MIETWIQCPVCDSKTRVRIREDTVLENFPLYCPKCKHETLISARQLNISVIKEPNHQRDRNTGSFIGYTGSISVPVVFRYDNSFYSKMIQQKLAANHSYNGHSMAENCKSTWHCILHQMILINQKNIGTFLCNIQHTLRKATFTKYAIDNLIPRKSLANFCSIINFFF